VRYIRHTGGSKRGRRILDRAGDDAVYTFQPAAKLGGWLIGVQRREAGGIDGNALIYQISGQLPE
jgi:hypothetical protein